jgi:hypothetical protein
MSLLDAILNSQDGAAVQQLGAQFGLGDDQTTQALSALVPAIAAGVHHNVQSENGLESLMNALSNGQHQQYVSDPAILGQATTIDDGNAILGHVFGDKDVSRQVAAHAAAQTGIGRDILKKMLPIAATLVMGALAKRSVQSSNAPAQAGFQGLPGGAALGGGGGDLISVLASTLGQAGSSSGGGLGGLLGSLLGRR